MKLWSDEHATAVAKEFAAKSVLAEAWRWVNHDLRDAILDSVIMGQMRIADCQDPWIQFRARDVVAFRSLVRRKLAEGIKRRGDVSHFLVDS